MPTPSTLQASTHPLWTAIAGLVVVMLGLTVGSVAGAKPIVLPHAPQLTAETWGDAQLDRAQAQFQAGQWTQAHRTFAQAMARIRREASRSVAQADRNGAGPKQGPGPLRGLSARYLSGKRPVMVVVGDRFHFAAELLRMQAWAASRVGDEATTARALIHLLISGQANAHDRHNAQALVTVRDRPLLQQMLNTTPPSHTTQPTPPASHTP
ncbi:MAG: hypothetical protein AAFX99_07495 [Myxococcota bacterium]